MPEFLEKKLRAEYGNDKHAIYGTMNEIGAMHGNKETAKGRAMEKKHELHHMEIHPAENGGHTVQHHFKSKRGKGPFMEHPEPEHHVFGPEDHEKMMSHISEHLGLHTPEEEERNEPTE